MFLPSQKLKLSASAVPTAGAAQTMEVSHNVSRDS